MSAFHPLRTRGEQSYFSKMRKVTPRDWLALSIPATGSLLAGAVIAAQGEWLTGAFAALAMLIWTIWYWRRQIQKHPENTWRTRL